MESTPAEDTDERVKVADVVQPDCSTHLGRPSVKDLRFRLARIRSASHSFAPGNLPDHDVHSSIDGEPLTPDELEIVQSYPDEDAYNRAHGESQPYDDVPRPTAVGVQAQRCPRGGSSQEAAACGGSGDCTVAAI